MKKPLTIFLFVVIALLIFSNWLTAKHAGGVTVPTCGAKIIIPVGCGHRVWGNAVEVNCKAGNTIYTCNPLKQPSPASGLQMPLEYPHESVVIGRAD